MSRSCPAQPSDPPATDTLECRWVAATRISTKRWRASRDLAFDNQGRTKRMKNRGWTRRLFALALTASAAMTTFVSAQAQDNTIAKIKARGKLVAGVKFDTPPFGFLDEKNQPVGFDIDLMRKVAEHIGVPVELVSVTSPT